MKLPLKFPVKIFMKRTVRQRKPSRILPVLGRYFDDILVVLGIGFLAAAGFVLHTALGLAVLGVGFIGFAVFISLGK